MVQKYLYLTVKEKEDFQELLAWVQDVGRAYYLARGIQSIEIAEITETHENCLCFIGDYSFTWDDIIILGYDPEVEDYFGDATEELHKVLAFSYKAGVVLLEESCELDDVIRIKDVDFPESV